MKKIVGVFAILSMLNLGLATVFAAEQGMQGQTEKKKSDKQQKAPGAGPMGEVEKGGGGPSGPKENPTGKAPGFEGAGEKKSGKSPTAGGH